MTETDLAADHWEHAAESRWHIGPDADGELTLWDPDGATVERESTAPLPIWRLLTRLHEAGELHRELTARWTAGLPTVTVQATEEGRWRIEADGHGAWLASPAGDRVAHRMGWQMVSAGVPGPLWHALEHLHRHGLLHAAMERRLPPPANAPDESELDRLHRLGMENAILRQDVDRLRREVAELEAGSQRLSIQRQELRDQLDRAEARAVDAPEAEEPTGDVDEPDADADELRRALAAERRRAAEAERRATSYAEETDSARSEIESWKARALRPAGRDPRGPGQALHPDVDVEPQSSERDPDERYARLAVKANNLVLLCNELEWKRDRLHRQLEEALEERNEAQAELRRLREKPAPLRIDVKATPSVTQAEADQLREALRTTPLHPGQEDDQEDARPGQEDRLPMDMRSALINAAVVAVIAAAVVVVVLLAS